MCTNQNIDDARNHRSGADEERRATSPSRRAPGAAPRQAWLASPRGMALVAGLMLFGLFSTLACSDEDLGGTAAGARGLRINEVVAGGSPDWIELYNNTDQSIDLSGFRLSDDPEELERGTFPGGLVVEPGAYVQIDINDESVGFRLGSGESVVLSSAGGAIVDQVNWEDGQIPAGKSFGRIPNGVGGFKTLDTPTPAQANQDNADAATCGDDQVDGVEQCDDGNFEAGDGCSPACQSERPALEVMDSDIKVNEVMALHSGDELDWVELINIGQAPVDLTGWTMGDEDPAHIALLPGVVLAPGDFVVIEQDTDFAFGFNSADAIYLYDDAQRLVEAVDWSEGDMMEDMSFGRLPDGTGDFQALSPSKGSAN